MKPIQTIAVAVFATVGLLQLLRLLIGFDVVIAGRAVPLWASLCLALAAGLLALLLAREARKS